MKAGQALAGQSRRCPHSRAQSLKSAASCPMCQQNLRFVSIGNEPRTKPTSCQLSVEGTLENGGDDGALEYILLMEVRDEAGKVISRQSVGVGAIPQQEKRIFSLRIETTPA